ncbi:branched-chain amino acid ABC transporter permease [Xanthobacter sp. KR7-225]|uniref:branched-chain amino acid ABC transporter permease n=1 Tax=Xanthobacter sp. KR7-225 TaxID=3156613 RepID=UPI0032B62167
MSGQLIEQIVNGVILGAIYALMGAGLTLIYGTMRVLNFAYGEFYMLGGYAFLLLTSGAETPWPLALVLAAILVFAFAAVTAAGVVQPLLARPGWDFSTIAATLGISIAMQNAALAIWGERFQSVPYMVDGTLEVAGLYIPYQRLLIVAAAAVLIAGTAAILSFTRFGRAVRATAQDREAARVLGVPADRTSILAFAFGSALAALAGMILAPIYAVSPWMGVPLALKAFAVVVLGGLGSFRGAVVAGLLLGIVEAVGVALTSSEWREAIAFAVLIAVIWVRPWGLYGMERLVR